MCRLAQTLGVSNIPEDFVPETSNTNSNSVAQPVLLARYKENCDQARHHETLRERTTAMVAQTSGVMLGLVGFKEGQWKDNPAGHLIAVFIVVLGAWGVFSSLMFESRARRHRSRIDSIRVELETGFQPGAKTKQMVWVWVLFHTMIIGLGMALFFKLK